MVRRRFSPLKKTGSTKNGGVLPERGLRVLQITDTHLHADPEDTLAGINTLNTLKLVLRHVAESDWKPDIVIATGDLVHDASPAGYRILRQNFESLNAPTFCLPGNHDCANTMRQSLAGSGVSIEKQLLLEQWQLLFLDSTLKASPAGHLGREELDFLHDRLEQTRGIHTLVCLHHHPVPVDSTWMDSMSLDNPEEFFQTLDRFDHVRGIVWGHIHQSFEQNRNQLKLFGTPSTCIQFAPGRDDFCIDQSPPGYRRLELFPDGTIASSVIHLNEIPEALDLETGGY
jgi:Icc protein